MSFQEASSGSDQAFYQASTLSAANHSRIGRQLLRKISDTRYCQNFLHMGYEEINLVAFGASQLLADKTFTKYDIEEHKKWVWDVKQDF